MNDSKLFILHYINMQEELNLDDKERMWSFLKEATDDQLYYYVENGSCVNEMKAIEYVLETEDLLNEVPVPLKGVLTGGFKKAKQKPVDTIVAAAQKKHNQQLINKATSIMKSVFTEPNVDATWKRVLHPGRQQLISNIRTGLGATVIAAVIAAAAYKAYKHYHGQYVAQCIDKEGKEKSLCIIKAKVEAKKQQYAKLQKASAACDQTKDPKKCKLKLKKKMDKVKNEISKAQSKK